MIGSSVGVLFGGWATDRAQRPQHHAAIIAILTCVSAVTTLCVGILPMTGFLAIAMMFFSGMALGGSRTPRDVMLKDAAPPGEIGKVFGYVSAALPLGGALVPVPFGWLIDHGHAELVLILAAMLLAGSLFCMGTAKASSKRAATAPAE